MTRELRFPVVLRLRSPFLFEALEAVGFGIDGPALRDPQGVPILPGDHLRGHLWHAIGAIGQSDPKIRHLHRRLFGEISPDFEGDPTQNAPRRGIIDVPDFPADPRYHRCEADFDLEKGTPDPTVALPQLGSHAGVRVQIDDVSGAAKEGSLQFVELVAPQGAVVTFRGDITVRASSDEAGVFLALLRDAFALIPAIGGSKTVGFGEIVHRLTTVGEPTTAPTTTIPAPTTGDRFDVTVTFDRPLLVDGWANASNLFRGGTIVPGATIKGALANMLAAEETFGELGGPLGAALSKMKISHAFPLVETKYGARLGDRAVPLSLVATRDSEKEVRFADSLDDRAWDALIGVSTTAVGHAIDWKHEDENRIRAAIARPTSDLERSPRGRVAIEDTGVAAKGQLFVVAPVETSGRKWRFTIYRNDAEDASFVALSKAIAGGVSNIGRTGARMTVTEWTPVDRPRVHPTTAHLGGGDREVWVVVLETGAMLTDPCSDLDYAEQYRRAFVALSGCEGLELVAHFARRKTIGGHLAIRHRRRGPGKYVTSDLTLPGSVFALAGEGVGDFLARAVATGFGAVQFDGDAAEVLTDRGSTPFLPENGWGQISVEPIVAGVRSAPKVDEEG